MKTKEIAKRLQDAAIRPTAQRIAVYQYLLSHRTHPTADTIFRDLSAQYPTFSRTTIYNSVHALADAGLIRCITIDAEEQRFDGCAADHGHFRCRDCHQVFDFPLTEKPAAAFLPEGFRADSLDVYVFGLCPACAAKTASQK